MTLFFYLVIAIITFFAFLHAYAKKSYDVSRTMVINASKKELFNYVSQLRNQSHWMPWFRRDREAVLKFKGIDGKEGAAFYWRGNNKVGEGTQKIVKLKPKAIVETRLLFVRPIKLNSLTYIGIKEMEPEKSKIVWGLRGFLPFPLSIISIFYSVDKLLGNDLEKGLINLKAILENRD